MLTVCSEAFLPFDLEYAFSSAIMLRIVQVVLPQYIPDRSWRFIVDSLLDHMIQKGSMVAGLRKSELAYFDQLLRPLESNTEHPEINGEHSQAPQQIPTPSFTTGSESQDIWDQFMDKEDLNMDPDELFDLAMQFGLLPELNLDNSL